MILVSEARSQEQANMSAYASASPHIYTGDLLSLLKLLSSTHTTLIAVETYGGLGKSARKLINQIVAAAEDQQQLLSSEEIRKELTGSLAIAVQKGNAKILLAEYHRAVSGAARYGKGM